MNENPFDAFDQPDGGVATLEPPTSAPEGNPFDQFDSAPAEQPALTPESAAASAARAFKAKLLPAIGTAAGAGLAGLVATPESAGIATIPAAIAGGAAGGALGEKGYEYLMGEEDAKRERAQIALNEQAHPWASTAGGAIPTLISLVGGGGLVKTLGAKAAQGLEGAAAQEAIKKATAGVGTKIAEASLTGARLGASETAQRAVQGDDVGVADFADSMARDAVAFGPFGLLPHVEQLGKALGMAIPQAYLSTIAGAAYDSMVHGKPFDIKDVAGHGTAEVVPFALFNAIAHGVQAGHKRLVTTKAQNTATTAADSAEAAGMPQTAQVLRDLAAKAAIPAPPVEAAPVAEELTAELPPLPQPVEPIETPLGVPPLGGQEEANVPHILPSEPVVGAAVEPEPVPPEIQNVPQEIAPPEPETTNPKIQDETGQVREASVPAVPDESSAEPPILSSVQGSAHEGVAENASTDAGTTPTGERQELRTRLPGPGEDPEAALRELRSGDSGDAPRGLSEATGGDVDVPTVPSGAASGPVDAGVAPEARAPVATESPATEKPAVLSRNAGARKATPEGMARVEAAQQRLRDIINNPDIVGAQRADMIEAGKNLIAFLQAHADTRKPLETDHRNGDLVAFTGEDAPEGFRDFIYLEGNKAGEHGVSMLPEVLKAEQDRKKKAEIEFQEGVRRVRESGKSDQLPLSKPATAELSAEEKSERAQMIRDMMATNKSNGKAIPQGWVDKLAELEGQPKPEEGEIYSNIVPGHPQSAAIHGDLEYLVPIKVSKLSDLDNKFSRAQATLDKWNKLIGTAEYQLKQAKTPAQKAKAQRELSKLGLEREARELLRNETIPELERLHKELERRHPSAKASTDSSPTPPELAGGRPAEVLEFTQVPHSELSREDAKRLTAVQIYLGMAPRSRGLGILASVFAARPKAEVADDAGRTGSGERPVGGGAGRSVLDTIEAFERATGRKVYFVGSSDGRKLLDDEGRPLFSALTPIGFPDAIFVNKDAPRHLLALVGHEWGHTVDATDPALYHAFKQEALRQLDPDTLKAMREDRRTAGYTEAQLDEEVANNVIGDAFLDPTFWRKLQEHDRPLWQKMVDAVTRWIESLFDKVRKSEFGTTEVLRNVEETHQAIIDLMNGSNKEPGKLPHYPIAGIDYSRDTPEPPNNEQAPPPPTEPPLPEPDAPPEKVYGFYNAAMDAERERLSMELAERAPYMSVEDLHSEAHRELVADPTKPERILDEMETDKRPVTAEEDALLRQYGVELQMQLDATPEGDPRHAAVYDKLDRLLRNVIASGSRQGQAFRMRQTLLDRQFDVAGLARRWMAITGKSLTPAEWAHIRKEAAEFKELNDADKQAAYSRLKKTSQDEIERLHQELKAQEEASSGWLDDALDALDDADRQNVDAVLKEVQFLHELSTQAAATGIKFSAESDQRTAANRARLEEARARVAALGKLTPEVVAKAKAEASAKLAKLRKTFADPAASEAIDKAVGGDKSALKLLESLKESKPRTTKPADPVKKRFADEVRKPGPVEKFVADLTATGVSKENAEKLHAEALKKSDRLTKEHAARKVVRQALGEAPVSASDRLPVSESSTTPLDEITQSLSAAGPDIAKVPVSLLRNAVRTLVASGLRGDEQVMPELTKLVNAAGIKVTEEQVRERAVDYGHAPTPKQDEPDKSTREALAEALKVASIKRVENKKPLLKTGTQRDKPHQKLRELYKVLKEKMRAAGISPRTSEQQLASVEDATLTRLRNDIEDLQAQIDAGARAVRNKTPASHTQKFLDEQSRLKEQKQKLVDALDSLDPAKPMTAEEREARLIRAAERSAEHWRDRLKNAEWEDRAKPGPPSEKVLAARENAAAMKELFEQARDLARPDLKKDPEALALARYNRLLDRREADLARRMSEKDYSKPIRNVTVLDDATAKRKIAFERKLRQFNADARDAADQNRTPAQKFWDFMVKMKRSFVLTYPAVIGKLTAASLTRGFTTLSEELAGGAMGRLLPSDFTTGPNRARIEGGVLKAAGYVEAAKNWHMKWIDDMKKTFALGESDLDVAGSKQPHEKPDIWGLPGRIHAAIKAPIKRALYEFAMAKQIQSYLEDGHDPADLRDGELLHMRMAANAYKYAERGIFLNDNVLVGMFNSMVRTAEAQGGTGKGIARAMRVLMPIVKVPTNIISESFQMVGGLPIGLVRLAKAWHTGFDKLDQDERESILRTMKKGSLGAGLVLFGYYSNNPAFQAGGYYNHDDKRKPGDPKVGGFKLFGVEVPHWLTHAPAFEAIQFGATIRRAQNNSKHGNALPPATMAALLGLAEETPFLNEMFRIKDLQTETGRGKFFAELAKAQVVPGLVQQVANWTDRARPLEPMDLLTGDGTQARRPNGFKEIMESGVPGLRQKLSYKVDSPFSPRRAEQIPEVLHAYAQHGPMPSLPERTPLEKKLGHPISNPVWNTYTDIRGRAIEREMLANLSFLSSPADEKEKKRRVMEIASRASHEARQALGLQ